jgi:MYXO-CTERM domain-containing protein
LSSIAFAVALAAWPTDVRAQDTWTEPHPGMRLLRRTTATPWRIFAVEADLCHPGVSLRATKSEERQRTTSSFGQLVGAEAAVNGDFFSFTNYSTTGLAIGDGAQWPGTGDAGFTGFVAFGRGRAELTLPGSVLGDPPPWMREVVSGRPWLVDAGVSHAQDDGDFCTTRHPRTAVGISEDGRTLILAVVDGRTTQSVGMRCTELGALMRELGAYNAINLDGGGSTTMWVRGDGVVNNPSDGTQRVVANHLAVLAEGLHDPGSCDRSWEEAVVHGDAYDASTTTDIDGDGTADLCARAAAGIRCVGTTAAGLEEIVAGPELSDQTGWADASNWSTLRMGDLDGDGRADLCARADAGIRCWLSEGDGFSASIQGPPLADDVGWAAPQYAGTLRMADIDGDGRDDLCARAAADFRCWPSTGDGFADPWLLPDLSDEAGFDTASRYGTIRMGDVDADNRVDVCARTADGMRCWRSTGSGFEGPIEGPHWSDDAGWDRLEYWSTIRLVDLDGDRRADLCARSSTGLVCHLSTGDGFGPPIAGPQWSDDTGWADYDNYSTIRFGDLDGDGQRDVCARANAGIVCSRFEGDGFGATFTGPPLADASGWNAIRFYSTIRLIDFDGDGLDDLCARSSAGVQCWPSTGDGFGPPVPGPGWSDASGWGKPQYYATFRGATPRRRCLVEELCNGVDDNCDGQVDEGCPEDPEDPDHPGTDDSATTDTDPSAGDHGTETRGSLPDAFDDGASGCSCRTGTGERLPSALALLGFLLMARRRRSCPAAG